MHFATGKLKRGEGSSTKKAIEWNKQCSMQPS
jgi:hypothetical protein